MESDSEVRIGDEIINSYGFSGVVVNIHGDTSLGTIYGVIRCDGNPWYISGNQAEKTGRHFPQVEELLAAMQAPPDG